MTAPRYECTWARTRIQAALQPHGIPLTVSGGVFYGQLMQRMLQQCYDDGVDYALTIDFDSVFTAQDVNQLIRTAVINDLDAVCAAQAKRGQGTLLGSYGIAEEIEVDPSEPLQVRTAHFGLTLIRLSSLAAVPKPWFVSVPDGDGGWGDGRTDDDVHFWYQWESAGNEIYIDLNCRIGHLEEMVTCFDDEMKIQHLYPSKWCNQNNCSIKLGNG